MAGLTDFFGDSWEDPKSQAIMALAGGLMGGDWKKGLLDYGSTMSASKEAEFKKKIQQAQLDKYVADIDMDKQKILLEQGKAKRSGDKDAFMQNWLSGAGGEVATPNMPVTGTPESGASPTGVRGRADPFAGVDKRALMLDYMQNDGKKMGDWVNDRTAPKWVNIDGNLVNTNAQGFQGGFQAGFKVNENGQGVAWQPNGSGGLTFGAPEGAMDTFRAYKNIEQGVKDNNTLATPITLTNGKTILATNKQLLDEARGQAPQQPMQARPMTAPQQPTQANKTPWISPDKQSGILEILNQELRNPRNTPEDIAGIKREIARAGGNPQATAPQSAPSFGLEIQSQAGKDAQKLTSDNAGKVNDVWLKSSYTPVVESKGATAATIDSINQSRAAMNAMGGTGWGTETKATAANVLTGLGIGGKNAEMYATNAQTFQQAAMTRLQSELALQKGPQTEGDSTRQAATYAALKNTPQANSYILDSAQAKAERDLMKAKFYESALPIASKKGDLQEIDREWNKRAPSLFSMPSMQKWNKK